MEAAIWCRTRFSGGRHMSTRITVLGAGFGGMELSTMLSEALGDKVQVTLIDKADAFIFGFSKLDVMFGTPTPDAVRLPYSNFVKPGVRLLRETVTAIDPVTPARDHRCRHARGRLPGRRARRRLRLRRHAGPGGRRTSSTRSPARPACATCCPTFTKGPRRRRRLRRALQVPAGAQRMRADAARLPARAAACASDCEITLVLPLRARCRRRPRPPRP